LLLVYFLDCGLVEILLFFSHTFPLYNVLLYRFRENLSRIFLREGGYKKALRRGHKVLLCQ
jgi:hypothetical protein